MTWTCRGDNPDGVRRPKHLLLGLVHDDRGVAAETLKSMGIGLEDVRSQVLQIIGHGQRAPSGHIPFTPRAKKVVELSLREAEQLGHPWIDTEHLLLGLIREGEGVGAQVLLKLGADLNGLPQRVLQVLAGHPDTEDPAAAGDGPDQPEISRLRREIARLRRLLSRHGLDPDTSEEDTG